MKMKLEKELNKINEMENTLINLKEEFKSNIKGSGFYLKNNKIEKDETVYCIEYNIVKNSTYNGELEETNKTRIQGIEELNQKDINMLIDLKNAMNENRYVSEIAEIANEYYENVLKKYTCTNIEINDIEWDEDEDISEIRLYTDTCEGQYCISEFSCVLKNHKKSEIYTDENSYVDSYDDMF
ncbi:hypothetical protein [Clostridium sp. CTA-6]